MMSYIQNSAAVWTEIARTEAMNAMCMEIWLANLKERWAGFTSLRGLTRQKQEQVLAEWCQQYFGQQDGELGRYLMIHYIMGDVGGMGGMMPAGA